MSDANQNKTVTVRKGQVWDCGKWGRLRVEGLKTVAGNRCVNLVHMSGGEMNSTRGDKVGLYRAPFENGTYKLVR